MFLAYPGLWPTQQRPAMLKNSPISKFTPHFSSSLSASRSDTFSLRFGASPTVNYLNALKLAIESKVPQDKYVVERVMYTVRVQMGSNKAWHSIPGMRAAIEELATQHGIDHIELQEQHGIGPRQEVVLQQRQEDASEREIREQQRLQQRTIEQQRTDYLKDLKSNIERITTKKVVADSITALRNHYNNHTNHWYALPYIRETLESLASQHGVDFIELQESHGIGPRPGVVQSYTF